MTSSVIMIITIMATGTPTTVINGSAIHMTKHDGKLLQDALKEGNPALAIQPPDTLPGIVEN